MTRELILYTTSACSRCESAMTWLLEQPTARGLQLRTIDVATDDGLLARFGERVPLLQLGEELMEWPFDESRLNRFTSQPGPSRQ